MGSWFCDRLRLNFLSFCVTWHLRDGRESCHVCYKKVTYFKEFGYQNSLYKETAVQFWSVRSLLIATTT